MSPNKTLGSHNSIVKTNTETIERKKKGLAERQLQLKR